MRLRDKQRRALEKGFKRGMSDEELVDKLKKEHKLDLDPRRVYKLRRGLGLLTDEERVRARESKRRLVKGIGIGAAGAVVLGAAGFGLRELVNRFISGEEDVQDKEKSNGQTRWLFEEEREISDTIRNLHDVDIVRGLYVPVGRPRVMVEGSWEYNNATSSLSDELILQNLNQGGYPQSVMIKPTKQYFVVPEDPEIARSFIRYGKIAKDFMQKKLKGFKNFEVDWIAIKKGDNFTNSFEQKCFVGKGYFVVESIDVYDKTGDTRLGEILARTSYRAGSRAYTDSDHSDGDESVAILSSANPTTSLVAPFSELIPIALSGEESKFEGSYSERIEVIEALSEALSYKLASELSAKLGIKNAQEHIEKGRKKLKHDRYKFVENAIRYVEKHGMQKALDLYMQDMNKFKQEILKS